MKWRFLLFFIGCCISTIGKAQTGTPQPMELQPYIVSFPEEIDLPFVSSLEIEEYLGNHEYLVRISSNEKKHIEKAIVRSFTWKDKMSSYDWSRLDVLDFSYIH